MKSLLERLNIQPVNPGACTGPDAWFMDPKGKELVSYNPATGEALARIIQATPETYEKVASTAQDAFLKWREVPAPKRGEIIRDLGDALRELKEPLGDLVTVEMGKISRRRAWRSSGNDRHLRFRSRSIAYVVRSEHAFGASRASDVRAVASPRDSWVGDGLQLSSRGLVMEFNVGSDLRRYHYLEAFFVYTADCHCGNAYCQ